MLTSAAHQMLQPITVKTMNFPKAISPRPATTETNERRSGMNRPKNTNGSPRRLNHASTRSRSRWLSRMYLPSRSTAGRPPYRPMA